MQADGVEARHRRAPTGAPRRVVNGMGAWSTTPIVHRCIPCSSYHRGGQCANRPSAIGRYGCVASSSHPCI